MFPLIRLYELPDRIKHAMMIANQIALIVGIIGVILLLIAWFSRSGRAKTAAEQILTVAVFFWLGVRITTLLAGQSWAMIVELTFTVLLTFIGFTIRVIYWTSHSKMWDIYTRKGRHWRLNRELFSKWILVISCPFGLGITIARIMMAFPTKW